MRQERILNIKKKRGCVYAYINKWDFTEYFDSQFILGINTTHSYGIHQPGPRIGDDALGGI